MAFLAVFLQILEYFFQILQNSIIFASFVFKINPFWICIIQNSSKFFTYFQILSFLKISPWNLKFSFIFRLSPLCMNEEKWKKSQEIKFYIDLFSNSVVSVCTMYLLVWCNMSIWQLCYTTLLHTHCTVSAKCSGSLLFVLFLTKELLYSSLAVSDQES